MTAVATRPLVVRPEFSYLPFGDGCLEAVVDGPSPPFTKKEDAFHQLKRVEAYAKHLTCKSIVVESPYIDRDHMEDHSAFYSRALHSYPNYCTRVHFFTAAPQDVESAIDAAIKSLFLDGPEAFRTNAAHLSRDYLGFTVVKPLGGSPVGRTILKHLARESSDPEKRETYWRCFEGCRDYKVHLLGIELTVRGLAFQQQDTAVSACATTAIWASLQKLADHEDIALPTPAQITGLASRYSLPFGRAMPSEGLSLDQMCQAIQAVGLAPSLFKASNLATTRAYIYSAIKSGIAPILIIAYHQVYHAVVATGMKLLKDVSRSSDAADNVTALYIHDDRRGPYLRAELNEATKGSVLLIEGVPWTIAHIIAPVHPKNRLSFAGLRDAALHFVAQLGARGRVAQAVSALKDVSFTYDYWISKPHLFVREQFARGSSGAAIVFQLMKIVVMPRYLGVVRARGSWCGDVDLLVDTTANRQNARCLAIIPWNPKFLSNARLLSVVYGCPVISSTMPTEGAL